VKDTTKSPHIACEGVFVTVDDLGAEVERSANSSLFDDDIRRIIGKHFADAEIANEKLSSCRQKQVLTLEITMDDPVFMNVLEAKYCMSQPSQNLTLRKGLSTLPHFLDALV